MKMLTLCAAAALAVTATTVSAQESEFGPADASETYYWISQVSNLPLFVQYDYVGLEKAANELGVKVRVAGPTNFDVAAFISTVNQVCAQDPAGVSIVGWVPSLTEPANSCLADGVPTVVDDADLPDSSRLSFIGTSWAQIGEAQADAVIRARPKGGKVAMLSIISANNMREAIDAFKTRLKEKAPDKFTIVANEDDEADSAKAAQVTSALLAAHPDLAVIAGFDAESGAGIVRALKEFNLQPGDVTVTAMEQSNAFYNNVKEGWVDTIIVQNRQLFTYYAIKMLYDYNHNGLTTVGLTGEEGGVPIPVNINTGLLEVTKKNVDKVIKSLSEQ